MKFRLALVLTCFAILGATTSLQAQFGAPGRGSTPPGVNPAIAKAFGKETSFTASAEMRVFDASGTELMSGPVTYAFLDGSTYFAMDMSEIKSAQMLPQAAASLKQMGMAEMTTISKAGAKSYLLVYPGMQAYTEMPLPTEVSTGEKSETKTESLGEETLNGHKCKKNKLTITEGGKTQELLTWNATDMKDFPVRIIYTDASNKVQLDYTDVKLEKPAAKLFEAPAGYTKYGSAKELLQGEMMKRIGAPPAPK